MKPITLFLMTEKGFCLLRDTVASFGHLINEVIVGTDAGVDDDYHDQIVTLCQSNGIPWLDWTVGYQARTKYIMAVSWRRIIIHPEQQLIIFHDSLLPKYRGFNPLVSCLINGEKKIGVTALFGAKNYDSGDILAQSSTSITYPITIKQAIQLICENYRIAATEVLERINNSEILTGRAQTEATASFSLWRDEDDYRIPWIQSAEWIARFVNAVGSPYKKATTLVDGILARVGEARPLLDVQIENRTPGKVIWIEESYPVVVCGQGLLKIIELTADNTGVSLLPLNHFRTRFS